MLRLSVRDEEFLMIGDDEDCIFGKQRRTDTYHDRRPQGCEHRTKQGH